MRFAVLAAIGFSAGLMMPGRCVFAQPVPQPIPADKYGRGLVPPPDLADRQKLSYARKGLTLVGLPRATETEWDSRAKGWVPAPRDQSSCGSCWDFSAVRAAEIAAVKANREKADAIDWSEQAVLNCGRNGGCNGDWPETALEQIKNAGIPDEKDVPYVARVQACNAKANRKNTVDDYGYVGPEAGVPAIQAIKDAIKSYGAVSCAVAADDAFAGFRSDAVGAQLKDPFGGGLGGIFGGSGATQINHAITLVGWKDDAQGGYWILSNSWGPGWCEGGYIRIRYGANRVGYGAMYVVVHDLTPPTPPVPPVPPGPTPPQPAGKLTGTITVTQAYKDGVPVGPAVTSIVPAGGSSAAEHAESELRAGGFGPEVIADVVKLLADFRAKADKATLMNDVMKLLLDLAKPVSADPPKCCGGDQPAAWFRRDDPFAEWADAA